MKKYLIVLLGFTLWFCFNQPSSAAYRNKMPAPVVQAEAPVSPTENIVAAEPTVDAAASSAVEVTQEISAAPVAVQQEVAAVVQMPEGENPEGENIVASPAADVAASEDTMAAPAAENMESGSESAPMPEPAMAITGKAIIKGTTEGSAVEGWVSFTQTAEGLQVEAQINNVPNPGNHGFHIHEVGDCSDEGKAAGGHYNPEGVQHGHLAHDGHAMAHAGDMGNIVVDETGKAVYSGSLPGISLTGGQFNVNGLSVILHEKEDDFGQPTGNAGGRIGCGIISME